MSDTDKSELETLFQARKELTDTIVNTSASYTHYATVVSEANKQIEKLDALIFELKKGLTHGPIRK